MRNNLFFILLHRLSRRGTPKCRGHSFRSAHLPSPRASGEAMGVNMDTIAYFASAAKAIHTGQLHLCHYNHHPFKIFSH